MGKSLKSLFLFLLPEKNKLKINKMFKQIFKENQTGKEHSLKYDNIDNDFAHYLRSNFYNVKLSNESISFIKKEYLESK